MGKKLQPNIFEYDNYRTYLRELYTYFKSEKSFFSFRYFSKAAGFRSPNFFKLVMDGDRNLTGESIEKFIKGLKLSVREAEFFRVLVGLNQAVTVEEKKRHTEQVLKFSAYRKLHPLKKEQHDYYAKWFMIPIREMVGMSCFQEDPAWIAKYLRPQITPFEAEKAICDLLNLGLLCRDENGRLVQSETIVTTGDEVASASVAQFLRHMTFLGAESVDTIGSALRDVSSVTLTLSHQNFIQIKALVQKFRKELLAIANNEKNPEGVFQINFQLFPLTKVVSEENGNKPGK